MVFDPTITAGNVLTAASVLAGVGVTFGALRERLINIEKLLAMQEERLAKAEDTLVAFGSTVSRLVGFCEAQHRTNHTLS